MGHVNNQCLNSMNKIRSNGGKWIMNKQNAIILVLVTIIIIIIGVGTYFLLINEAETKLEIISNSELLNGDIFTVKLTDSDGKALANETIKVTLTDEANNVNELNITTDSNGVASFTLNANEGNYLVKCVFDGGNGYKYSDISQNLSIQNKMVLNNVVASESSSESNGGSSSSDVEYDEFGNRIYTDEDGLKYTESNVISGKRNYMSGQLGETNDPGQLQEDYEKYGTSMHTYTG